MSKFSYVARDIDGSLYRGVIEATDKREVRTNLRQKGFYPTSIRTVREWKNITFFARVTSDEVAVFADQLSVMVDSGLTLVRCLTTLAQQTKNEKFRQIINAVRQDVENGISFADSLSNYPKVFSNLFVSLIRTGEIGGVLSKSLRQIAEYLNSEKQIRQKVKATFIYPKIVLIVCVLVSIFLVTFVVPRFMTLYDSLKIPLPLPTRIVLWLSKVIPKYWWLFLGIGGGVYFGFNKFKATKSGKNILDHAKLYAPVFGELIKKIIVSRFIKVLSALTMSGVPIVQSLDVSKQVADNAVMDRIIDSIRDNVNAGGGLREPMANSEIFPPIVIQMVGLGEEVGNLGESLDKSAKFLDSEIEDQVKRLMSKIEPMTTVAIAAVVGLILLAIYLPMFDITKIAQAK
ncbi:TPA: type II secretion system F family protein [bacterium]|nr:type II secretion system F family protein [bacterium]